MNKIFNFFLYFFILILVGSSMFCLFKAGESYQFNKEIESTGQLQEIIQQEIQLAPNNESWDCSDYTEYYFELFQTKYPMLHIQQVRRFDLCNSLTEEDTNCQVLHAFVVVGGFGTSCTLDQTRFTCLDFNKD